MTMIVGQIRKAKKQHIMSVRIPVYGGRLLVVFTDSILATMMDFANKPKYGLDMDDLPGEPLGFTYEIDGNDIGVFVDTKEGTSVTLAHELIHVCSIVLEKIGMRFVQESEEAYTYLHSALMYICMEFMKKNKINPW